MAPGVELGVGYLSLTVSAKGIAQDINRELGQPVDKAAQDAGRSIEDGIGGGASRGAAAAKVALSAIGSAAILSGINKAKDAASGLQQAVGGTTAVFGEASAAVDDFAQSAAESVGLSERSARELTSQLGASLKGYGFAVDEAAAKSIELTTVGADLAATFGGTTADAVAALSSALRGEFDPLERYGVALRQSAIDAEAVELGLVGAGEEVSAMARAQAALSLITEQSADAQGQFARESGSAAGQSQIAAAKMEDSAANLGESLLPIYARISETLGTVADVFAALPGPVQTGILALAGIVAVAGPLTNVLGLYRSFTPVVAANTVAVTANASATNSAAAVQNLYAVSTARATLATRAATTALAAGAAAFAGYAIGSGIVAESRRRASEVGSGFADQVNEELGAVTTYADRAAILNQRIGEYNAMVDDANSGADIFKNDDLAQYTRQLGPALEAQVALNEVIEAYARETGDADEATRLLSGSADEAARLLAAGYTPEQAAAEIVVAQRAETEAQAATQTEAYGAATEAAAEQAKELADAVETANTQLSELFDISESVVVIESNLQDALRDAAAEAVSLAEAGASNEERYGSFIGMLEGSIGSLDEFATGLIEQGVSAEEAAARTNAYIDEVFGLRDEFGLTRQQAEELRVQLSLDYPTVTARVEAVGLAETNQDLAELFAYLESIRVGVAVTGIDFTTLGALGYEPRAAGGPMVGGQSYLFEGHPEILTMGPGMMSGQVTPLADVLAPASDGGGAPVTQNFYGPTDAAAVGETTFRELRRLQLTGRT